MTIVSWAQNAEDIVLWRAFRSQRTGIYVDVGAGHPLEDSVTRLFFEKGWSGVNIEPLPAMHQLLVKHRPRDVNLAIGISDEPSDLVFWQSTLDSYGISTFSEESKAVLEARGYHFSPVTVRVRTLDEVLVRFPPGGVDFLKIDVEGWEHRALIGANLHVHQPKAVVVEAVESGQPIRNSENWEPILVRAGYRPTLFDGLNLFFVHRSHRELVAPLSVPANLFDDWVSWRHVSELDDLSHRAAESVATADRILRVLGAPLVRALSLAIREPLAASESQLEALVYTALRLEPRLACRSTVPISALLDAAEKISAPNVTKLAKRLRAAAKDTILSVTGTPEDSQSTF